MGKKARKRTNRSRGRGAERSGSGATRVGTEEGTEGDVSLGAGESTVGGEAPGAGWAFWALLGALVVGVGCAGYLSHLHLQLKFGHEAVDSVCDFGSGFDCSKVNMSDQSEVWGVPIALVAIPVYLWMLVLSIWGWIRRDVRSLGAVGVLGAVATLYSVFLAYVSAFVIGEFCLFCMTMYVVNLAALVLPCRAAGRGWIRSLRDGLEAVVRPELVGVSAATLLLASGVAWWAYSSGREDLVAAFKEELEGGKKTEGPGQKEETAKAGKTPDRTTRVRPGQQRYDVPIDDTIPFVGPADAPVTFVVYDDFQCPFCRRLVSPLEQLRELYPDKVRIGLRHFPMDPACNDAVTRKMHPNACNAARAAECARQQGAFWPYYHVLFRNARDLSMGALKQYARDVGLDVEALTTCMADPATTEKIRADARTGGALKVTGTPTFFVNGRRFSGALAIEMLKAIVESELAGREMTMREIREAPKLPDIIGKVETPEMIRIKGPFGWFEIDAVEASIQNGKAVAVPGVPAATNVDWFEAAAACKAAGKRLCTEGEWLTACQGAIPVDENHNGIFSDDRLTGTEYPYGDLYKAGLCNDDMALPTPQPGGDDERTEIPPLITGNHPKCRSAFGVYDLSGNVREWVGTVPNMGAYIGGAFQSQASATCHSRTESWGPYHKSEAIGFRCCRGGEVHERVTHPGRQVGQTLTPFTADLYGGGRFDSRSLAGKPMLITFWASWCRVCRQELPAYESVYSDLKKMGFEILAVNTDREPGKVARFLEEIPLSFPILLDPQQKLYRSFDAGTLPTSYLVDGKGQIRIRRKGFRKGDERRLVNAVEELLQK